MVPLQPDLATFRELASRGNLVPVYAELTSDYETPISAFRKLCIDGENSFLLESAEKSDQVGRYSFLGNRPRTVVTAWGRDMKVTERGKSRSFEVAEGSDPLRELEKLMSRYRPVVVEGLPMFCGGAVGYVGYDMVRFFEPTVPMPERDDLGLPDMVFLVTETLVIFDHRFRRLQLVANVLVDEHKTVEEGYAWAQARIEELVAELTRPLGFVPLSTFGTARELAVKSFTSQSKYESMVRKAKEYILAGDAFQVVPSQRFEVAYTGEAIDLYRALRHINPSPYMFCLQFAHGFSIVGSSPEVHVRCLEGRIDIRPIAGTRWRGETPEQDRALAEELLADPKERAEHIMLVDLARNDVGRVAEFRSVRVSDFMTIERYSHVMHIVSNVDGKLAPGHSPYDVLRATFPAGTVTGAPKVRAMQIISELERSKRGPYAGAVGYFGFDGNHDSCIALRTAVVTDGKVYVQTGAGVVADSSPAKEYEETVNKAKGILRAVEHAACLAEEKKA